MILSDEQLAGIEDCRKANVKLTNDLLDTIADLKRRLNELEILTKAAFDVYVQERVAKAVLAESEWWDTPHDVMERAQRLIDNANRAKVSSYDDEKEKI